MIYIIVINYSAVSVLYIWWLTALHGTWITLCLRYNSTCTVIQYSPLTIIQGVS